MKTIGLIGGMSWESTHTYYIEINELINQRLGGLHSAKIVLHSFDFEEITVLMESGDWNSITKKLAAAANALTIAGAEFIVICTNTIHKIADQLQDSISIPLLHIADSTAEEILNKGMKKIGLLGTKFTMEEEFYTGRLKDKFGLEVVLPEEDEREFINHCIFNELCKGIIIEKSISKYMDIIHKLVDKGIEGIILGCTEISLLVNPAESPVPVFDTASIHAKAAVEYALKNS